MVSIEVTEEKTKVRFGGRPDDVAVDLATAVNQMYCAFYAKDVGYANAFKVCCATLFEEDSPVWDANRSVTVITMPMISKENEDGNS